MKASEWIFLSVVLLSLPASLEKHLHKVGSCFCPLCIYIYDPWPISTYRTVTYPYNMMPFKSTMLFLFVCDSIKCLILYVHYLTHRARLFLTDSSVQGFMLLVSAAVTSMMMMMLVRSVSLFLLSLYRWGPLQCIFPQVQLCPSSLRSQRGGWAPHGTAVHDGLWDGEKKKRKDGMRALKPEWNVTLEKTVE